MKPWRLEYNEAHKFVELTYFGEISSEEMSKAALARIQFGKENRTDNFLINTFKINFTDNATSSLHNFPQSIYEKQNVNRSVKIAIIEPELDSMKSYIEFLEASSQNHGWNMQIFKERESAINWLKQ